MLLAAPSKNLFQQTPKAFQAWSLVNVEGTAEEIFDAVTMLLEDE
jgi:hypothetical protein